MPAPGKPVLSDAGQEIEAAADTLGGETAEAAGICHVNG